MWVDRGTGVVGLGAVGGWFEPEDVGRAWDEAEAILLACTDLDAVMETIRDADSPVEARRALKLGFGFTGRQAAVLLTLPILSFTRSERERIRDSRRARMDLLADVTGVFPAISDDQPDSRARPHPQSSLPEPRLLEPSLPEPNLHTSVSAPEQPAELPAELLGEWPAEWPAELEARQPAEWSLVPSRPVGPGRRSDSAPEDAAVVLDEQVGELCDAIAAVLRIEPDVGWWLDDPRDSASSTGMLLDNCSVHDETGIRTLLWHLHRTGLESVEGLLPFADPLSAVQALNVQAARFEHAMATGGLGSEPGGDATWTGRLWPLAERLDYGFALSYRSGPGAGAIWAYGGGQPLHRVWDSVVDLLVELYQAFTAGESCDSAVATVVDGRVVWSNLS